MFEDEGDIFDGPFSKDFQKLSYSSDNQAIGVPKLPEVLKVPWHYNIDVIL